LQGNTVDGKRVVGNVFRYVESRGIPLDIVFHKLYQHDLIIDWIDFYEDSQKAGWLIKTTLNKIEEGLIDAMGKEYTHEVLKRLRYYIMKQEPHES